MATYVRQAVLLLVVTVCPMAINNPNAYPTSNNMRGRSNGLDSLELTGLVEMGCVNKPRISVNPRPNIHRRRGRWSQDLWTLSKHWKSVFSIVTLGKQIDSGLGRGINIWSGDMCLLAWQGCQLMLCVWCGLVPWYGKLALSRLGSSGYSVVEHVGFVEIGKVAR